MSNAYLSPILQDCQFSDDATFLAGGLIWFYEAVTSTPLLAYTGPSASVAWTNPIQLNARGETGGEIWLKAGSSYKMILESAPEYGQTHGPVISTFDNITGVNDPGTTTIQNWIAFAGTPTYIGSTSFSVTGDKRTTFLKGRRLKMTNNDATIFYGTVVSSTYASGITTIVVSPDYGQSVSSQIASVAYGFIETGAISSIPIAIQAGSAASGAQDTIWIDYDSTIGLRWSVNNGALSHDWPINAATATAAAGNSFFTQSTSSEGEIGCRFNGQADVYLYNNATEWGLLANGVATAVQYIRSTGKFNYGGFALPTQTGTYGYSALPNGMIMQWGYSPSSSSSGAVLTFPTSFTSGSSYAVTVANYGSSATTHDPIVIQNLSASQFKAYQNAGDSFYYIAMGY